SSCALVFSYSKVCGLIPPTRHAYCLVSFFFPSSDSYLRAFPSFPTRRSSDLRRRSFHSRRYVSFLRRIPAWIASSRPLQPSTSRSEEHTSELQSRVDLVCRLLLEKKNKLE